MSTHKKTIDSSTTRRSFIKKSGTAAAAVAAIGIVKSPIYGQNQAPSANVQGANSRILIGHIGVGGQGGRHVRLTQTNGAANNVQSVAVCDVSKFRKDMYAGHIRRGTNPNPTEYDDYRKLIEKEKDIDAIFVGTVDHWHTQVSIAALEAGKHVYCEKPMSKTIQEAFDVVDTWKATGKVMGVGVQSTSLPAWTKANELIRAGKLGKVVQFQTEFYRNTSIGQWRNREITMDMTPDTIDWDRWLGKEEGLAPDMPFDRAIYIQWRAYWPFGAQTS